MRKEDFKEWLSTRIEKKPISDCMSRCKAVETAFQIDLDTEYAFDKGKCSWGKCSILLLTKEQKKRHPPSSISKIMLISDTA